MTLHTPTLTHNLITCDACAYRAIITNRGLFVRDIGESPVDHQALLDAQKAQAERLLRRLVQAYNERRPLPSVREKHLTSCTAIQRRLHGCPDEGACTCVRDETLTLRKARQLGQWIKAEFGV